VKFGYGMVDELGGTNKRARILSESGPLRTEFRGWAALAGCAYLSRMHSALVPIKPLKARRKIKHERDQTHSGSVVGVGLVEFHDGAFSTNECWVILISKLRAVCTAQTAL
jgi:hypothetical protein